MLHESSLSEKGIKNFEQQNIGDFSISITNMNDLPDGFIPVGQSIKGCGTINTETLDKLWSYIQNSYDKSYFKNSYHDNVQLFDYIFNGQLKVAIFNKKPVGFVVVNGELTKDEFDPAEIIARRMAEFHSNQGDGTQENNREERRKKRQEFLEVLNQRFQNLQLVFYAKNKGNRVFELYISHDRGSGIEKLGRCNIKYSNPEAGFGRVIKIIKKQYDIKQI